MPLLKPSRLPAMLRSPGRPPMTSPYKPNARRPAMPVMPLARHGLENDSAPSGQVRRPTEDAALYVLVERNRPWSIRCQIPAPLGRVPIWVAPPER